MQDFKKLEIWKFSVTITKNIYRLTQNYPASEIYGITSQLRRAAVSISCNISEGCAKESILDKARFINISLGSINECINLIILSRELEFLDSKTSIEIENQLIVLKRRTISFYKSVRR